MRVKIIACEVMKEELLSVKPSHQVEYHFVSMGLHLHPKKLHSELQNILDCSQGFAKIILGFGLCGGAAKDLTAPDAQLIMPKVHDCIPVLLGSRAEYEEYQKERGTFYLSSGWMISEKDILSEHQRICDKYGEKKAFRVLESMYDSYKKVLFIHTGCKNETVSFEESREIAKLLKLSHHTVHGKHTYLQQMVNGPWDEENFIHVPPFGTIQEEFFGVCAGK
jgi:hypothetical protein